MLWLLLFPAIILVVVLLLFAPYAVRYLVTLVQIQFLKMAYGVIVSCLYMESCWRRANSRWQRWRVYRKSVRLMRKTSREMAERYQDRMRKIYRERS